MNNDIDEVEGNAAVTWSPAELIFTDMNPGITYSQPVTMESVGEVDLRTYAARVVDDLDAAFEVYEEDTSATTAPGQIHEVLILASIEGDQPAFGSLEIETNDPDQLTFSLPVSAYPTGWTDDSGP